MAELPELRTDTRPASAAPDGPQPLFGRPPAFGVARDLELMKEGLLAPRTRRPPRRSGLFVRGADASGTGVRGWWARTNNRPVDIWHRIRCRTGRHEIRGGEQVQLGSRFVYLERRCAWCDAPAPPP